MVGSRIRPPPSALSLSFSLRLLLLTPCDPCLVFLLFVSAASGHGRAAGGEVERHMLLLCAIYLLATGGAVLPGVSARLH